jgi:hypothetical protein
MDESFWHVVKHALHLFSGVRPSLQRVGDTMNELRLSLWDSASGSFRAAHAARVWAYSKDPSQRIDRIENDRLAQHLFEKRRLPKRNRRRRLIRNSVTVITAPLKPSRTSSRKKWKRHLDPAFYWNSKDEYVMDLDEIVTSGFIDTAISDRSKRALRRLCLLV